MRILKGLLVRQAGRPGTSFNALDPHKVNNQAYRWPEGVSLLLDDPERAVEVVLAPQLDGEGRRDIMSATPAMTVPLSMAVVETPDVPIDTPYCGRGEMPRSCFVALAA